MPSSDKRITVYQTGIGRIPVCRRCSLPQTECRCRAEATAQAAAGAPRDGFVRLARDRKNRGGKTMTIVSNIPEDAAALAEMTQQLKKLCGGGGTCKDGVILVQGDHRDRIEAWLVQRGYKVKRAGG
ncbi:MAG: translation initiation factor [Ktedonobacterales bacterium]